MRKLKARKARKVLKLKTRNGEKIIEESEKNENGSVQQLSKVSEWLGKFVSSKVREFESVKTLEF